MRNERAKRNRLVLSIASATEPEHNLFAPTSGLADERQRNERANRTVVLSGNIEPARVKRLGTNLSLRPVDIPNIVADARSGRFQRLYRRRKFDCHILHTRVIDALREYFRGD